MKILEQLDDFDRIEDSLHERKKEYCCITCHSLTKISRKLIKIEQSYKTISMFKSKRGAKGNLGLIFVEGSTFYSAHTTFAIAHEWGVYEDMIEKEKTMVI